MKNETSTYITQKEASALLRKSLSAVNKLTNKNRWRIKLEHDKRLVNLQDVLNYKPRKAGRPRKEVTNVIVIFEK